MFHVACHAIISMMQRVKEDNEWNCDCVIWWQKQHVYILRSNRFLLLALTLLKIRHSWNTIVEGKTEECVKLTKAPVNVLSETSRYENQRFQDTMTVTGDTACHWCKRTTRWDNDIRITKPITDTKTVSCTWISVSSGCVAGSSKCIIIIYHEINLELGSMSLQRNISVCNLLMLLWHCAK